MFCHNEMHEGMYRFPNGHHINQIDYVLKHARFSNSILDIRTVRRADSDHFLVLGRLQVKLKGKQEI